eukprot:scaffold5517_cov116-Isochrysis_galbana.AAC.4
MHGRGPPGHRHSLWPKQRATLLPDPIGRHDDGEAHLRREQNQTRLLRRLDRRLFVNRLGWRKLDVFAAAHLRARWCGYLELEALFPAGVASGSGGWQSDITTPLSLGPRDVR